MKKDILIDLLTFIDNAERIGKRTVEIPRTPDTERIVRILIGFGLVKNVRKLPKIRRDLYVFTLRIVRKRERDSIFKPFKLKRIIPPRIYCNYQQIPRVLGGMGVVILSTSRGIMTDREARLERIGEEVLLILPSEFYEKLRYILVNGVEKKQISNIILLSIQNINKDKDNNI